MSSMNQPAFAPSFPRRKMPLRARAVPVACSAAVLGAALLASCTLFLEPTPTPTPMPSPTPTAPTPTALGTPQPTPSGPPATPSPTPEPPLSLDLPTTEDARRVRVEVALDLPADGNGRIVVTISNLSEERIDEVVLRWPTDLRGALYLAPFVPSEDRIRDGGPPLIQDWTKWVEGPGERGEPAGTTSLGYGPMDPGMTLPVELFVTRTAAGPVAFDLQVLAGEALLTLETGAPAELRVEAP
jgi:hypothetical protein